MNTSGERNRSVRNTKRKLREGLIELLKIKPLKDVSVKELTDMADINRGTFYTHYQDVDAMVAELEDKFLEDFQLALEALDKKSPDILDIFIRCIDQNRELVSILLGSNGDPTFVQRMERIVSEKIIRIFRNRLPDIGESDMGMVNAFMIGGFLYTIGYWVLKSSSEKPEGVSEFLNSVLIEGVCPAVLKWQGLEIGK